MILSWTIKLYETRKQWIVKISRGLNEPVTGKGLTPTKAYNHALEKMVVKPWLKAEEERNSHD